MEKNATHKMAYPPPPPPLPSSTAKGSKKTLIVVALIVIVVIAVIVGAYVATGGFGSKPNASPSPSSSTSASPSTSASATASATASGSQTPTPSSTSGASATPTQTSTPAASATPQPSSSGAQGVVNFRLGAWANYTMTDYDTDGVTVSSIMRIKESIGEGSPTEGQYVGRNCWTMNSATDIDMDGTITTSTSTTYFEKGTMNALRIETTSQGYTYGYDINDTGTTDPGTGGQIDPSTIISYETITVPAGTFQNCMKAQITVNNEYTGATIVSLDWAHQDVPIWGIVKSETRTDGVLSSTMVLTAYG